MGCDIHGTVEKFVNGKWVMINRLSYKQDACDRNYSRFALLAGVRNYDEIKESPQPKGIPDDVSESTKLYISEWGEDGHSHSYLPLIDAAKIFLETEFKKGDFAIKYPTDHYFDIDESEANKCRLVFWFDN